MRKNEPRISSKGLVQSLFFLTGMAVVIAPAFFLFWLADWHKKADILLFGEKTSARVVYMEEEWSTWTSSSTQEAYKNYYIKFAYEDSAGKTWVVTWDSSYALFSGIREGYPLPVRFLPGPNGGAIPEGEAYQAFVDSGEYGPAGIVGLVYLLGAIPFFIFVLRARLRGETI